MSAFDPNYPTGEIICYDTDMKRQFNALHDENVATNQRIDNLPPPIPGPQGIQGPPGNDGQPGQNGNDGPAGPAGQNGADGRSFNPRGEWNSADTYNRLDVVSYSGTLYVCMVDGMTGTGPGMTPDWVQEQVTIPPSSPFPYTGEAEINGNIKNNGGLYTGGIGINMSDMGGSGEAGLSVGSTNLGDGNLLRIAGRQSGSDQYNIIIDPAGVTGNMGTPTVQHGDLFMADLSTGNLMMRPTRGITQNIALGNGQTLQIVSGLIVGVTGP